MASSRVGATTRTVMSVAPVPERFLDLLNLLGVWFEAGKVKDKICCNAGRPNARVLPLERHDNEC